MAELLWWSNQAHTVCSFTICLRFSNKQEGQEEQGQHTMKVMLGLGEEGEHWQDHNTINLIRAVESWVIHLYSLHVCVLMSV